MIHRHRTCLAAICAVVAVGVSGSNAYAGGSSRTSARARAASADELRRLLISDMTQGSERLPQGVPTSYDWARHPRARSLVPFVDFRAFTAWGQLYQCAGSGTSTSQVVQISNLQTWALPRGARRWQQIQLSSDVHGDAFPADYSGPPKAGHYDATATGTSVEPVSGYTFHFWPSAGRVPVAPARIAALTVAVRARLKPTKTATSAAPPCLVLSVGGDMWTTLSADPDGHANADVGIGRFKRVERGWRLFTMTTASASLLQRAPLEPIAPADEDF